MSLLFVVLLACAGRSHATSHWAGEAPPLAEAAGLSCYLEGIADGPGYLLPLSGGLVEGMRMDVHIDGELVAAHSAERFSAERGSAAPLGTYRGTLGGADTTIRLSALARPVQRFEHYRGTLETGDRSEALVCYRY